MRPLLLASTPINGCVFQAGCVVFYVGGLLFILVCCKLSLAWGNNPLIWWGLFSTYFMNKAQSNPHRHGLCHL